MGEPQTMVKFLKEGKIVVCLQGRYAGKKAVILKANDESTKERTYGHCVVAGIAKAPMSISKAMTKNNKKMEKLVKRRSRIKTFAKIINYTHLMPTRYSVESSMAKQLRSLLVPDTFTDAQAKKNLLKSARLIFESKYKENEGQRWLFEKLRFCLVWQQSEFLSSLSLAPRMNHR